MSTMTRRQFTTATAAAGLATAFAPSRVLGANERVRLGFIGVGNRGDQVLDAFLRHQDAEIVAVCDIYEPYTAFADRRELVELVRLARRTGAVTRAMSYQHAFDGEPRSTEAEEDWPVRGWLLETREL